MGERSLNHYVTKRKSFPNSKLLDTLIESINDSKSFWKNVKNPGNIKASNDNNISEQWKQHFEHFLNMMNFQKMKYPMLSVKMTLILTWAK